jgi:hypothetical protein
MADTSGWRLRKAQTVSGNFDRCRRFDSGRGSALSFVRSESKTSVQPVSSCLMFPGKCLPMSMLLNGKWKLSGYPRRIGQGDQRKIASHGFGRLDWP